MKLTPGVVEMRIDCGDERKPSTSKTVVSCPMSEVVERWMTADWPLVSGRVFTAIIGVLSFIRFIDTIYP